MGSVVPVFPISGDFLYLCLVWKFLPVGADRGSLRPPPGTVGLALAVPRPAYERVCWARARSRRSCPDGLTRLSRERPSTSGAPVSESGPCEALTSLPPLRAFVLNEPPEAAQAGLALVLSGVTARETR